MKRLIGKLLFYSIDWMGDFFWWIATTWIGNHSSIPYRLYQEWAYRSIQIDDYFELNYWKKTLVSEEQSKNNIETLLNKWDNEKTED